MKIYFQEKVSEFLEYEISNFSWEFTFLDHRYFLSVEVAPFWSKKKEVKLEEKQSNFGFILALFNTVSKLTFLLIYVKAYTTFSGLHNCHGKPSLL